MATFVDQSTLELQMPDVNFSTTTTQNLLNECIRQAEDEIRKRISKRYDLTSDYFQTSTATPPAIRSVCEWYSQGLYWEYVSRGGAKNVYERADRFLDKANDNLDAIAEFEVSLFDTSGSLIAGNSDFNDVKSNTEDYIDTFAEDNSINWGVDPDKLDDIESDRG